MLDNVKLVEIRQFNIILKFLVIKLLLFVGKVRVVKVFIVKVHVKIVSNVLMIGKLVHKENV